MKHKQKVASVVFAYIILTLVWFFVSMALGETAFLLATGNLFGTVVTGYLFSELL